MKPRGFTREVFDLVMGGHLRERGFDVDRFEIGTGFDGCLIFGFRFNCPCGRPVTEAFALDDVHFMQVVGPVAFLRLMAKRVEARLQRHIDGEGR